MYIQIAESALHHLFFYVQWLNTLFTFPAEYFSEFFWLKNPGGENAIQTGPWDIGLILSQGDCDTFQRSVVLEAEGRMYTVIFTVGYFMNRFSVYWTNDPNGLWADPDMVFCNTKFKKNPHNISLNLAKLIPYIKKLQN